MPSARYALVFVIDLVTDDNPAETGLVFGGSGGGPVGDGDILHPAKVGHVVDVAEFIDIRGVMAMASSKGAGWLVISISAGGRGDGHTGCDEQAESGVRRASR